MEEKSKKTVTVVHLTDLIMYPPVINLVENLINNGHSVNLVSYNIGGLPKKILENNNFNYTELTQVEGQSIVKRIKRRLKKNKESRNAVKKYMENSDVLWTTTDLTVRSLGKMIFSYRHVMQLMELIDRYPLFKGSRQFDFPIQKYAQNAWKVVVPEENRAYIQKIWWDLKKTPLVLPNKPYSIPLLNEYKDMEEVIDKLAKEKRKIILYLGVLTSDRNLENFAKAVKMLEQDYAIFIVGKVLDDYEIKMEKFLREYPFVEYLGYFPAPRHLEFLKYAYIGLLPYKPEKGHVCQSELNALYCAPNKIYEYSAFGVPMLGSDVMGLKYPFEKYDMGICCDENSVESIVNSIKIIDIKHSIMSENCKAFYDSIDLDRLVENILNEEE